MDFKNDPIISLTLPQTAGAGAARIVLGPDIPIELQAGIAGTPIAAIVWWVPSTSYPRTYRFQLWEQVGPDQAAAYYHEGWVLNGSTPYVTMSQWFGVPTAYEMQIGDAAAANSTVQNTFDLWADAIYGRDVRVGASGIGIGNSKKEGWHSLTLLNGWTNVGGSYATGQFRMLASPPFSVQVVGILQAGTRTSGTSIAQLPVNYRPTHIVRVGIRADEATATSPAFIDVNTDGNMVISGLGAAANIEMNFIVPLDA